MAFILLLAIVGGVASTETGAPAQPIPPAGIYRSGGNLELTTPGSVICNGLDLVRDCPSPPTQATFSFFPFVPLPAMLRQPCHHCHCPVTERGSICMRMRVYIEPWPLLTPASSKRRWVNE